MLWCNSSKSSPICTERKPRCVFTSGYVSNQTGIATIAKLIPNCLILSDALNHNSMIEGIRQSGCECRSSVTTMSAHLEELLSAPIPGGRN